VHGFEAILSCVYCHLSPSKCNGMRPSSICMSAAAYSRMLLLQKLKDAKPLTQPMCYAGTSNVRRFYENVKLPDRLFVLGDSAAAFNPVRRQTPGLGVPHRILHDNSL